MPSFSTWPAAISRILCSFIDREGSRPLIEQTCDLLAHPDVVSDPGKNLFDFFPDEITFGEGKLVGLTEVEARA